MPISLKCKNIVHDFCKYAREIGKGKAFLDISIRLFNDTGHYRDGSYALLDSSEIRVSDSAGLFFAMSGDYPTACMNMGQDEIASLLQRISDENTRSVLQNLSANHAITVKELQTKLGIPLQDVESTLFRLPERNIICSETDESGMRGYLYSANMVGIRVILCGCRVAGCDGETIGSHWISRK